MTFSVLSERSENENITLIIVVAIIPMILGEIIIIIINIIYSPMWIQAAI